MRKSAMALRLPASAAPAEHAYRVMRWTFRRDTDTVVCELGLNSDHSAYELRINPPWNAIANATETFNDALAAFQRHGVVERMLIDEGWSLESFESGRRDR